MGSDKGVGGIPRMRRTIMMVTTACSKAGKKGAADCTRAGAGPLQMSITLTYTLLQGLSPL